MGVSQPLAAEPRGSERKNTGDQTNRDAKKRTDRIGFGEGRDLSARPLNLTVAGRNAESKDN
jgi:hypothetical protein